MVPFSDLFSYITCSDTISVEASDVNIYDYPSVRRIIFSPPATIVFWKDNTKTVVKCMEGDEFNPYIGFLSALAKKIYGNNSAIKKIIDRKGEWPDEKHKEESHND